MTRGSIAKVGLLLAAALLGCVIGNSFAGKPARKPKPAATAKILIPLPPGSKEAMERDIARAKAAHLSYKGTTVGTRDDLGHEARAVHRRLADELSKLALVPEERRARFRYLFDENPEIKLTGWRGVIMDTAERPDGTQVKIRFAPLIASPDMGVLHQTDYWFENYLYSPQNRLTFLGGEEAAERPIRALISD